MADDVELPVFINLPIPTEIPYSYGIEATSGPYGCLIQCRGTHRERDKIKRAAALVGVSYGTFIRRLLNDAADVVIKQLEEKQHTSSE